MKKNYLFGYLYVVFVFVLSGALSAQTKTTKLGEIDYLASKPAKTWQVIDSNLPFKSDVIPDVTSISSSTLTFSVNSYKLNEVKVNSQTALIPEIENAAYILKKGAPHLLKFAESLVIPALDEMKIEVISSAFIEIKNVDIAPSKGNLSRDVDPDKVPYEYGKEYEKDEFFPGKLAELSSPYIIRSVRGQTVLIYPLQYNPVQKILRIYTEINVNVSPGGNKSTLNVLTASPKDYSGEFDKIYKDHFINYNSNSNSNITPYYKPLDDTPGKMLIICYDSFMDEMADFVAWKKQKGIPVKMVSVSSVGSSASKIKSYVSNYYSTNGLTYLLLVGDNAQVPASSTSAGVSDNNYGYISGNDHYADIFVGRFSAETESQVSTMVARTIHYERDVIASETWMKNAIGSASAEGGNSTADAGESDVEHMNKIETDLKKYGYTVTRVYETGGTIAQMRNAINTGTGLINYCGHGDVTTWVNVAFNISHINALTNENKLPFIMDVACVNGAFTKETCFAEAWLRATNNSKPTGAIGIYASTVNQDWVPPMRAQDEFVDILVESYSNNIKRTFAGAALNGIFDMIDHHGNSGKKMADTWTLFGDPSFVMRTKQPTNLSVNHASTINSSAKNFVINCTTKGALASLTVNNKIVGTGTVSSGSATVSVSGLPTTGKMKVTVTAYNKTVYTSDVTITGKAVAPVAAFTGTPTTLSVGGTVQFTDKSTNGPTSWSWTFQGGTPSTSSVQNPAVTYNTVGTYQVSLTVSNSAGTNTKTKTGYITVTAPKAPVAQFTSNVTTIEAGKSVKFTDQSTNTPTSWSWKFDGGTPSTSTSQHPTITYNTAGKYNVTLTASNSTGSNTITKKAYITVSPVSVTYCKSKSNGYEYEYISNVKINSFSNPSSGSTYSDFTSKVISLSTGSNSITLTPKFAGSAYNEYWKVWIDYNKDGDFTDSGEEVFSPSASSSAVSGTFTIPKTFSGSTRMRVSMKYGGAPKPCETFTYGEVEDYTVSLSRSDQEGNRTITSINDELNESEFSIYPNLVSDNLYVTTDDLSTEIKIVNTVGAVVESRIVNGKYHTINVSALPAGLYTIYFDNNGKILIDKFIKQ